MNVSKRSEAVAQQAGKDAKGPKGILGKGPNGLGKGKGLKGMGKGKGHRFGGKGKGGARPKGHSLPKGGKAGAGIPR
jgi:hypothetical protein